MKKLNIEDYIFIMIIFLIIVGGFLKPIIMPKKINIVENRVAYLLPKFSIKEFYEGTIQTKYEEALSDQIPLSNKMKLTQKSIEIITNILYSKIINNSYIYMNGLLLEDGYLLYKPRNLNKIYSSFENKANNYNYIIKTNPSVDFYLYYIERDTDIDFSTNKKIGAYEYLTSKLDDNIITNKFTINNIKEYKKYFYKTDHHWNYKGSYKAYLEISKMMGKTPIKYKEDSCLNLKLSGTKAAKIGGTEIFKEDFCFYKFNLPERNIYINNKLSNSYGDYEEYIHNKKTSISYGGFYGGDDGLIEFNYNNPNEGNLLIIGESFDNAITELLASNFNKTYNVDLRAYYMDLKEEFHLQKFIEEHDINKVLLIGNIDYFIMEEFILNN